VIHVLNAVVEKRPRWGLLEVLRATAFGRPRREPQAGVPRVLRNATEPQAQGEAAGDHARASAPIEKQEAYLEKGRQPRCFLLWRNKTGLEPDIKTGH